MAYSGRIDESGKAIINRVPLGLDPLQIEERRLGVYGTDAADIMAGKWRALWRIKTGREEPKDLYDRLDPVKDRFLLLHTNRKQLELAALMGHWTEPLNKAWYEVQTGREVTRVGEHWRHPEIPWMRCHPDGASTTSRGHPCVWDAKHVSKFDTSVIQRYTPQMTHNAIVGGYDWWALSVFVGSNKWELIEQEVDPFYASHLMESEAAFWGWVEKDNEPPEWIGEPKPPPKPVIYREICLDGEPSPTWPNWGAEMVSLLGKYGLVVEKWQLGNLFREQMKKLLPEDVGLVRRGNWQIKRDRIGKVTFGLKKGEKSDAEKGDT